MTKPSHEDPQYRAAVVDLLGVLAYGELMAFMRLAADAELAPTITHKAEMARLAVLEFQQHEELTRRLRDLGADPDDAMTPYIAPFEAFEERTRARTWAEGLLKTYVGDGIAKDFFKEFAHHLDEPTWSIIDKSLQDTASADFTVRIVRDAIRENPRMKGPLALWARRLMGEALSQAQQVAAQRDSLAAFLVGGASDVDMVEFSAMLKRISAHHSHRMSRLGLEA